MALIIVNSELTSEQLEQQELSSELLGEGVRRRIMFWEAAEGGAGVLRRLAEEPDALARVARAALEAVGALLAYWALIAWVAPPGGAAGEHVGVLIGEGRSDSDVVAQCALPLAAE